MVLIIINRRRHLLMPNNSIDLSLLASFMTEAATTVVGSFPLFSVPHKRKVPLSCACLLAYLFLAIITATHLQQQQRQRQQIY